METVERYFWVVIRGVTLWACRCRELFNRAHCVGRPGIEVRHAAQVPEASITNTLGCNDDFEKLSNLLIWKTWKKKLTGVINGLNIGNARGAELNSPKNLENWENGSMIASDNRVFNSDFE